MVELEEIVKQFRILIEFEKESRERAYKRGYEMGYKQGFNDCKDLNEDGCYKFASEREAENEMR